VFLLASSRIQMTVPEYYTKFISSKVNLEQEPKQCCPFHKEDTPSFSYMDYSGRWRCFGSCKTGGDVIDLHRMNYKLKDRKQAEESLHSVLGIPMHKVTSIESLTEVVVINEDNAELDRMYHLGLLYAKSPDRWVEMDYVMSIYPVDVVRLKDMLSEWGVKYD
jgi:hypothetical protein